MSDVIRDAIIRLKIELQKSRLEAPELAGVKRVYEDQAKAVKEVGKAHVENDRVIRESVRHHEVFGVSAYRSYKHASEGVIQLTRGIALMAASSEEDTRKMLEMFAKIEAGAAMAKGIVNLSKFAAGFTPVGKAAAATIAAVAGGVAIWRAWGDSAAHAAQEAERAAKAFQESSQKMMDVTNQQRARETQRLLGVVGMGLDNALTPEARNSRLGSAMARLAAMESEAAKEESGLRKGFAQAIGVQGAPAEFQDVEITKRDPAAGKNIVGFEQRRQSILEAERQLIKERYEMERSIYEQQKAGFNLARGAVVSGAGFGTFGLPGMTSLAMSGSLQAVGATERAVDAAFGKATDKAQKGLDRIADAIEGIAGRVEAVMRQLDQANAK